MQGCEVALYSYTSFARGLALGLALVVESAANLVHFVMAFTPPIHATPSAQVSFARFTFSWDTRP